MFTNWLQLVPKEQVRMYRCWELIKLFDLSRHMGQLPHGYGHTASPTILYK